MTYREEVTKQKTEGEGHYTYIEESGSTIIETRLAKSRICGGLGSQQGAREGEGECLELHCGVNGEQSGCEEIMTVVMEDKNR